MNTYTRAFALTVLMGLVLAAVSRNLKANSTSLTLLPAFVLESERNLSGLYTNHPYVARPGLTAFSPEPNQLRLQDLRGVDCYPQPNNLEVCGAADTTCVLLFTKSEELLPDINLTLRFSEGLEYGGFAEINTDDDAVFPPPVTDLDVVSDQNPEAPRFLISGVTRDSGAVYICFGVRAECGSDLAAFPPNITYEWDYTTEGGIFCEGSYMAPEDFGGTVAVPRVQFTSPLPGLTNLNVLGQETCIDINVTNTGANSGATGYIFTSDNYGFDEGIEVSRITRNGMDLSEGTEFTVSPVGLVTANVDLSDNPLQAGQIDQFQICYLYESCYPDVDFSPVYTVVSACDGVLCTGPADVNEGSTLGNTFNFPGRVVAMYDVTEVEADDVQFPNDGLPSVCDNQPYVFDVTLTTNNRPDILGDINDLIITLRECASTTFSLSRADVINSDGSVAGTLDPGLISIRTEDRRFNNGTLDANNLAGTVRVDLRQNSTVMSDGLTDDDGDGFFDDLNAGDEARIRFYYQISCTAEDGGTPPAAGSNQDCQIRQVRVDARRGCNSRSTSSIDNNTGAPEFNAVSTSSFVNGTTPLNSSGSLVGYQFGAIGNSGSPANCNPRPVSTQEIEFTYNLGVNPLTACPNDDGRATAVFSITGVPDIVDDAVFSNFRFRDQAGTETPIATADTSLLRTEEGIILTIDGASVPPASAATSEDNTILFDITLDTAYCSPVQFLIFTGAISTVCATECDCSPTQTGSSSFIAVNPEDCGCDCYIDTEVFGRRISRGFTDETRTTLVPPIDLLDPQGKNVLAGDTIELTTRYRIQDEAATSSRFANEIAGPDVDFRQLIFDTRMSPPANNSFSASDNFPATLDYGLTRLQSFSLIRDGVRTDLGSLYAGLQNGDLSSTGVLVAGFESRNGTNDFPVNGEVFNPGFPDGGYTYSFGGDGTNDQRDGKRLVLVIRGDPARNGEFNAARVLLDAIGELLPGDEFETVWTTVLVDNPGQVTTPANPEIPVTFTGIVQLEKYIIRDADIRSSVFERGCPQVPVVFQFEDPQVEAAARVVYEDSGCEGVVSINFTNSAIPAGWYPNEVRPVTGVEQFTLDISTPYYFPGQSTFDALGETDIPLVIDSAMAANTATLGGLTAIAPAADIGTLTFIDAEFADGVRPDGYANFDNGLDDVTTVGGTLPLLAVGGGATDSVVVRVPIRRLCGDDPNPTLDVVYNWANRHLPDYEDFPYRQNTSSRGSNYWDGKVVDNNGDVTTPDNVSGGDAGSLLFYFPFQRLPDFAGDEINPHRSVGNSSRYQVINQPAPLNASTTINPGGSLQDVEDTDEVNTITITPDDGGQTLTGTVAITVGTGAVLNSVTDARGPGLTFTQALITDSLTAYAVLIPDDLGPGESFTFDLATDLAFCAAPEICIFPILGCTDEPEASVAAYVTFAPDCMTEEACYRYIGGQADLRTTIDDPATIGLCESQRFTVQYFNDGTSPLGNFSPVLYIPEGLTASNFTAQVTGGAELPITDPTNDTGTDAVFGTGLVFAQADLNGAFAAANAGDQSFLPGQVLTIMFDGQTGCDFTSGVPIVTIARGDAACGNDFEAPITFSRNVNVAIEDTQPTALFAFDSDDDPLEVSCSEDGDQLIVTISNVGKAGAMESQICLRLPSGIDVDLDDINAIAPTGFTVTAADITETPINTSGDRQLCFDAPTLAAGGFVCLEIPVVVGDLPCGPVFVGGTVVIQAEVGCANPGPGDTNPCTINVSSTEMLYFQLNVVPAVTANDAELSASCTGTPGVFDVDFNFEFVAESQPFDGDVVLSLFTDVDANGELDPEIDAQVGTSQTVSVALAKDEAATFTGVFPGVDQGDICPLLLSIESLGCTCSEAVLPFPEVLPDFVDDLGDNVALCPGESFTFEGICADLSYAFENPSAGTVVVDETTGAAIISLNDGFGINAREPLIVTGAFGTCGLERRIGISTVPDLNFGPYEYSVCSVGEQEVDLNIPQALQEDVTVEILNPVGIENPNSVEPNISGLTEDMVYDVIFTFNDGECTGMSTLSITVEEAVVVEIDDLVGCQTGFNLSDRTTVSPAGASGVFQSDGDGVLTNDGRFPGDVSYTPGPADLEAGSVNFRFVSDEQPGPCGPAVDRITATIQLADCGSFFWDGSEDD